MATKIIFRKIAGRIIPIRTSKAIAKNQTMSGKVINSLFRKRLRRQASGIPIKKGKTGFYSEGGIFRGSSLIPRSKGGILALIGSNLKTKHSE